ncbi:pyridoxal-phosphate dependent enzyme [Streptomyces fructofermentans]|uniref:pyridoxal-phosphate dependent enzyme n=1 Tax=Streptomyces fructofermentans TaxID=152141 RepID=UPI001679140B|nr:pyridoxal-phosphate dependent enzyme [Streptomyces fructofermentans]
MTPLPDCFCPVDGTRVSAESLAWCCPVCRGPLDLDFAPTPASLKSLAGRVNSLWRYAECLPLPAPPVSLGEGRTPLVPLKDGVSAKLDFLMPTLSFKDRGAVLLAGLALRLGPRQVVADSSGNAGTAVAAYCARAQLPCTVYVPEGTSAKKLEQIGAHGARLEVVGGDREAAALAAREAADEEGTFYASHVFNPYFLHGTKTYVHEVWEDLGGRLPEVLVLPVGNGTLLLGAALAVAELHAAGLIDRRPALYAVQAAAVAPLAHAWDEGADDLVGVTPAAPTFAEGIAIPRPPRARQILRAVRESGGTFLTVTEDRIRHAQSDLASQGLYVESTGVACWAAVRDGVLGSRTAVVPLCGAGAKTGLAGA